MYRTPEGVKRRVMLPAGAMLVESVQRSGTLKGMVGVFWEGRHYSVSLRDLLQKAERVSTA
jgi:hypothetical protein